MVVSWNLGGKEVESTYKSLSLSFKKHPAKVELAEIKGVGLRVIMIEYGTPKKTKLLVLEEGTIISGCGSYGIDTPMVGIGRGENVKIYVFKPGIPVVDVSSTSLALNWIKPEEHVEPVVRLYGDRICYDEAQVDLVNVGRKIRALAC